MRPIDRLILALYIAIVVGMTDPELSAPRWWGRCLLAVLLVLFFIVEPKTKEGSDQ